MISESLSWLTGPPRCPVSTSGCCAGFSRVRLEPPSTYRDDSGVPSNHTPPSPMPKVCRRLCTQSLLGATSLSPGRQGPGIMTSTERRALWSLGLVSAFCKSPWPGCPWEATSGLSSRPLWPANLPQPHWGTFSYFLAFLFLFLFFFSKNTLKKKNYT